MNGMIQGMPSLAWSSVGLRVICALCCCLSVDMTVAAERLPVRMKLGVLTNRGRTGGAIPVRIKLEYNQPQIMEGDVELKIYNAFQNTDDLMATVRHEGIVLQGNDYFFNTILPPLPHSTNKSYLVEAWFITDTQRIPLTADDKRLDPPEPFDLLTVSEFDRDTLLCSCSGALDNEKISANRRFLNASLSLSHYQQGSSIYARTRTSGAEESNAVRRNQKIQYYAASWDARELPADPLSLCCFDMVLLADESLSRLEQSQMTALSTWVRAGGSLCILPDDRRLGRSHLGFLQELLKSGLADSHLTLADDGTLLVIGDQAGTIINARHGFGRVSLLPNEINLEAYLNQDALDETIGFLWKVRQDYAATRRDDRVLSRSELETKLNQQGLRLIESNGRYFTQSRRGQRGMSGRGQMFPSLEAVAAAHQMLPRFYAEPSPLLEVCNESLMPGGVAMVPSWVIGIILCAYILTIGPVDYFLLGMLKLRKLTWVMFPIVTAIYTMLTVQIAHNYMSSSDTGKHLIITDLVEGGVPARETAVQMHFLGSRAVRQSDAKLQFLVTAAPRNLQQADPWNQEPASERSRYVNMEYSGRFPQAYSTSLTVQQWAPQMTRSLSLSPEVKVPQIPWDDSSLVTTPEGRRKLATLLAPLQQGAAGEFDAVVLNGSTQYPVFHTGSVFSGNDLRAAESYDRLPDQQRYYTSYPREGMLAFQLIKATGSSDSGSFFSIVSQVSPQGSALMEDLTIMDLSDPRQWALIVLIRHDDGYQVFRRCYHVDQ